MAKQHKTTRLHIGVFSFLFHVSLERDMGQKQKDCTNERQQGSIQSAALASAPYFSEHEKYREKMLHLSLLMQFLTQIS